ncbi:Mitochondrial distribution and morphology protein 12, partial [Coemansia biformis]
MSLATSSYSMLGSLRRGERQPTVELARPAPEVEFSRVADVMRPMLRNYVPADSPSLLSLRANQHGSDFAGSPLSQGSMGDRVAGGGLASARLPLRAASSQGGRAEQAGAAEALPPLAYFHDERDVPFRSNAVEIAAQDDKRECAFLSQERHGMGGEIGRARSILPLVVGQMQPTAAVGSEPAMSGRELVRPLASGRLLAELDAIGGLNQRARGRLADSSGLGAALPQLALRHMRVIVRQLLDEIEVPVDSGWDQVILDLAANAVGRVRPNVRGGDKMDLRHYVRIKRIPGGAPRDSQYVSGIVFTKNLAHRQMPRFVAAPRIMLLTLPLEYTRQSSRYVSFDEELRMQQGFTEKLVQRIAGAAPSVVMADKPVPRQVLEGLMRNRIAVVQGVKRGVIRAVARCTGAEIVTSMDKFSSYPRTGTCEALAVQTYEHPSLPEFRKSFVFLDGCIEHLGGTIVLRGEPFGKLGDLKQVVDLVICLAYSAYLETALLLDEFALAAPGKYEPRWADPAAQGAASGSRPRHAESESLALLALSEYDLVLSSSPSVRIPPPHVLVCMREKELAIRALAEKFGQMTAGRRDAPPANGDGPAGGGGGASGFGTGVSFLVSRQLGAASANRMRQQYESELALHESYVHEGRMFLQANPHAVSLWDYQSLAVAYMLTCRKHDYCLCVSPQYHLIPFYAGADATLGQYLEMCFNLDSDCIGESSRCVHPMYEHCHSYIHGTGRVDVTMDEYPCPIERLSEITLMWSECARCGRHTPVTCMSDETSRYSFGKYLEATFYCAPLRPRAAICGHDLHRDFVRCFTLHNMVVRFAYTELRIWNIAAPTTPLYFNMDVSIRVKDEEAAELRQKMDAYYASLASSLDEFPLDLVYKDKAEGCRHLLQSLSARAATEHVYFQQTLVQTLRNTHPADTLVLVVVYEALQGKVVEWNLQFSELARLYIQVDPSGRGAASTATKRTGDSAAPAAFAPGHEIDTLEIIDELHSAANHHYAPADVGAHASMRFAMPRLRPSPSASAADLAGLAMRAEDSVESAPQGRSRLHRRLSMEMMRQERVQLERLIERQRYAAELADGTKVKGALRAKGHAPDTHVHADADARTRQHASATAPLANAGQRHARGADPSGFSTARLIQPVAADTNDAVRDPRQTQFPELRGHRGKGRLRLSGLATKGTQPLLDILHKSSAPADPAKEAGVPPTRIPGIRQQQQTQQDTQVAEPLATAGDRRSLAGSQPANARHSNIPRPPNIRSRATSPTGGEEHGRGSSNVFLRLAKRLNGARGQHGDASALGTMSRKMDLLLPTTAQYMSQQQPKRPPAPQVQVFYTRPSANESPSREPTPPRRHSYQ